MFRIRFILGFVILITAQFLFAYFMLQSKIRPQVIEDADIALQRSAGLVETVARLDEFSLLEKARFVAQRTDLRRAMVEDYEGDAEYERHVNVHRLLERDQIRFTEFMAPANEEKRNLDLDLMNRRPAHQEIFMALDETGRGVATLGQNLAHWMGDNVAADFPVILDVMETGTPMVDVWNWSWRASDDKQLYTVAIAPMLSPEGNETIGVVILGNLIDNGVAHRNRSLIADGFRSDGSQNLSPRQSAQAPDVTFFRGNHIYSSTLRSQQISQLGDALFEELDVLSRDNGELEEVLAITIDNSEHRGIVRYFAEQQGSANPAGFVLVVNSEDVVAAVEQAQSNLVFFSAAILLLGLILIAAFFYLFLKPFERLEDGVQVIISGDKDHVFETGGAHQVVSGLAHHLNLMSAYLQGKPMPDDDAQSGGGWDDIDGASGSSSASKGTKPAVAGVPMNFGSGDDADANEATAEETT